MKNTNKYKTGTDEIEIPTLESIAEAWVRLCLFHIKKTKEMVNQYKDKKYENRTTQ